MNIDDVINILESAPRLGGEIDSPEGTRYIIMSDTLANLISETIKTYLNQHAPEHGRHRDDYDGGICRGLYDPES